MIKSLLVLLCMVSVEFHAPEPLELIEDVKTPRQMLCDIGFWHNEGWVRALDIGTNGLEVQPNPVPDFKFKISDVKIRELLEQVGSVAPKTFKGCELSTDYPNILQYMEVKLETKNFFSSLKSKVCAYLNQTTYHSQYFAIDLRLPDMEVDMGDLIVQKIVRGQILESNFDTIKKQKILIGEPFVLCTSPINTANLLCNEFYELIGKKRSCELRLWNARTVNNLLDQSSPESQIAILHTYRDIHPTPDSSYAYYYLYRTFKVPLILQKHTEDGRIKVKVKFDQFATLPFYFNGGFVPVSLRITEGGI